MRVAGCNHLHDNSVLEWRIFCMLVFISCSYSFFCMSLCMARLVCTDASSTCLTAWIS